MDTRSTKVISDFFSTLLDDSQPTRPLEQKPLADLLAVVSEAAPEVVVSTELAATTPVIPEQPNISEQVFFEPDVVETDFTEPDFNKTVLSTEFVDSCELAQVILSPLRHNTLKTEMLEPFPVLYFKVADVTMAVPLIKLKGIYPIGDVTKLIGKPNWFHGVQVERGENISVINTAKYIFGEKDQSELEQSLNYKYIIVLGDSNWGLLCEELIDSCVLNHQDIKWRTGVIKSPWLAGTVKQRMCGLLAVDALVELLSTNTND